MEIGKSRPSESRIARRDVKQFTQLFIYRADSSMDAGPDLTEETL